MLHFFQTNNDLDLNYMILEAEYKQFKSKCWYFIIFVQYLLVDFHVIYKLIWMRKFPEY